MHKDYRKIVQNITIAMVNAFRDQLDLEDADALRQDYSVIISSVISSVSATMMHMWADTVIERDQNLTKYKMEYGVAIEKMLITVGENVISTYEAKMQTLNPNREVH